MDLYYKQEVRVGFLVITALVVVVASLVWLSGRTIGRRSVMVDVQFESVTGLTEGDPVQVSGVRVGRVAAVILEGVDRVLVRLEVARDWRPNIDARAAIRSVDLLGAKYVEYSPGSASDELPDDAVLVGGGEAELAATATALADRAAELLLRGQDFLSEDMAKQIQRTMEAVERALDVIGRAGDQQLITNASSAMQSVQHAAAQLDSTLSKPAIRESVDQLDEIAENLKEMTEGLAIVTTTLGSVLQKMDTTQGTVGMLLNDSLIYNDVHEVLQSLKELIEDIKEHPGRYVNIKVF